MKSSHNKTVTYGEAPWETKANVIKVCWRDPYGDTWLQYHEIIHGKRRLLTTFKLENIMDKL